MANSSRTLLILGVLGIIGAAIVWSQESPLPAEKIRTESVRVIVPISVLTDSTEPLIGLKKENFRLLVDRKEVREFQFLHNADIPVFSGVAFDHSSTAVMQKFSWLKQLVTGLIHQFSPEDEFFLATYGYSYAEVQPPTTDRIEIMETMQNLHPYMFTSRESFWSFFKTDIRNWSKKQRSDPPNKTAIALDRSLYTLSNSPHPKKILILLSDGDENMSDITLHHIQRHGIPCYMLYVKGSGFGSRSLYKRGQMISTVARESGGRVLEVIPEIEPSVVGQQIASWVRNQYLISFEPDSRLSRDKTHAISVEVDRPEVQLFYRKSFRFVKE